MPTRILYGTVLSAAAVGLLVLDGWLAGRLADAPGSWSWRLMGSGTITAAIFTAVVVAAGIEFGRLLRAMGHHPAVGWACLAIGGLMLVPWTSAVVAGGWAGPAGVDARWSPVVLFVALAGAGLAALMPRRRTGAAMSLTTTVLMIVYVGWLGSFAVRLRCEVPGPAGAWVILCWLAVAKLTDIGAYFCGVLWGRTKLLPTISPGKTVEGLVGGTVLAVAASVLAGRIGGIMVTGEESWPWPAWPASAGFGVLIALVGQLGDLTESLFKRAADRKDSGALVPSFGGVLDIIDSPLLTAPLAWWLLTSPTGS